MIDLDLARQHLRVEHQEEDALITQYINAAQDYIGGEAGYTNRLFGPKQARQFVSSFAEFPLDVRYAGDSFIQSVAWTDRSGENQQVPVSSFYFTGIPDGHTKTINIVDDFECPPDSELAGDIEIIICGTSHVPPAVVQAGLMLVGHWYRNREAVVVGTINSDLRMSVNDLLQPYRYYR